jgi:hypothetical protein
MLWAAARFGHPDGWLTADARSVTKDRAEDLAQWVGSGLSESIVEMLLAGKRVPEDVLGPEEADWMRSQ